MALRSVTVLGSTGSVGGVDPQTFLGRAAAEGEPPRWRFAP